MTTATAVIPLARVAATVEPGSPATAFFQHVFWPSAPDAAPALTPAAVLTAFQPAGHVGTVAVAWAMWTIRRSCARAPAGTVSAVVLNVVPAPEPTPTVPAPLARSTAGSIVYGTGRRRSSSVSSSD